MQYSLTRLGFGLWIFLGSVAETGPRADIPPPPILTARVLASTGCAMPDLSRAFARRREVALSCMGHETTGSLTMSCTFDAAGVVLTCEAKPSKGSDYPKRAQACIQKSLSHMKLDPKAGDPTKCAAQIEFHTKHRNIVRPYRCQGPDDPLCGI